MFEHPAAQRKIKQNLAMCTCMNLHLWPHHSISPPNQKKTHKSAGRPMPSAIRLISTSFDFSNYKIAPRKEIQFRISTKNSNNCLSTSPKLQNTKAMFGSRKVQRKEKKMLKKMIFLYLVVEKYQKKYIYIIKTN